MKKILLLSFIMTIFLSCKKYSNQVSTETLNGKWSTGGYDFILYDGSGKVVSHGVADAIKTYWTFDNKKISLTNDFNTNVISSEYTITNTSGQKKLLISNSELAVQKEWKIDISANQNLQISAEITERNLLKYGDNLYAVKGKKIIYFVKE